MCGFQGTHPKRIPVTMAKGSHLFPYRTQKLSLSAPMVLGWRRPGRVGRCRIPKRKHPTNVGCFLFASDCRLTLPGSLHQVQHCTWLGCLIAVPSGIGIERAQWANSEMEIETEKEYLCDYYGSRITEVMGQRTGADIAE